MIRRFGRGTWPLVDLASFDSGLKRRRDKEVIDPDSTIVLESLPEVMPEGELSCCGWIQRTKRIGIAKGEHGSVENPWFWLEKSIVNPRRWFMAVDVFWDNVEVTPDDRRYSTFSAT